MNISRNLNGNIVYDLISSDSIVITSKDNLSSIKFDKGILVNNAEKNVPSFQSYNGILYYNNEGILTSTTNLSANSIINTDENGEISQTTLNANSVIYTTNQQKIQFIPISKGILNTYSFAGNTVSQSKYPQFTDKIVLNNCEIVTNSGRIIDNYLIYGKSTGGLSNINIPKAKESSYEYYYIVNAGENAVNLSSASQIYTDLYNKEVNKDPASSIEFNAIPICTSPDNNNMNLNVLVPNAYIGNYYINSDGDKFSLKLFSDGSILPSQLKVQDSTFNYKKQDILTVGTGQQRNDENQVFNKIPRSTGDYDFPYLSGYRWGDLKTVKFLNSNNCSTTANINYGNSGGPLVASSTGNIYKVTLPANKKYILTNSCFSQLAVDGKDLRTVQGRSLNLKNILQITDNKETITTLDNVGTSGILHTDDQGNITTFTQLDTGDISDNAITGSKLNFADPSDSSSWSNIIIDNNNNKLIKRNNTLNTAFKYGVLNYHGEIKSLTANLISEGTMSGDRIANGTITGDRLAYGTITGDKLSLNNSARSGTWNNILLDTNNNLIKTSANVTNYGVFASNGNVTTLDAQVLNSVGLKFFTPTTDEGKIDESSYFATKFTVYSSNSGNIDYNCSYYTFANYNSITSFSKKILCNYSLDQNKNLYNNSINNTLSNTYKLFYEVIYKNKIDKYIKINTSIYINSVTFTNTDLIDNYVNNKNLPFTIDNLKNNNLKLIVGVYTNLYNNNDKAKYYDIMYVNNNIYQLLKDITGGINDMLLGYVIVDTKNLVADYNNDIYTATINKQYDFESYININSSFENFDYSPQNILTFRPLYYINESNNTSSLFYYNTYSSEVNDFIQNFTYDSIDYYKIGETPCNYVNVVNCSVGDVDLPDGSVLIDKTNNTLVFVKKYGYTYENNKIIYERTNEIFTNNETNKYEDGISTIISEDNNCIYMHLFINKPFESNLKFNIKPITTYTHIKYNKSSSSYDLTNPEFIFSLFNFTLTVTDYVGEYPSIIQ